MGYKDTKAKEYLSNNERFADLCNVVLFDGEQIIKSDQLEEKDSTEVLSVFGTDKKEIQQQRWRDLLKSTIIKTSTDMTIVLIGIENQSDIHYAMPVKTLIYDALNYSSQVNEAAKRHRQNKDHMDSAEFLSGFKKTDELTPVVTITVYWGSDVWDGKTSLHEMFGTKTDVRLLKYIPNCEIALITPNTVKDFSKFKTPVGDVLELIKKSTDKKAFLDFILTNPRFKRVDNETVSAINLFTGIHIPINKKEGTVDMCKAMEDFKQEYIEVGIEQGIEQGIVQGIEQGIEQLIIRMLKNGKTVEQIAEFCDYDIEQILAVQKSLT